MATVVLNFRGGPKDGGFRRVSSKQLTPNEFIERRFSASVNKKSKSKHLYQSQKPWEPTETQADMHYLGIV